MTKHLGGTPVPNWHYNMQDFKDASAWKTNSSTVNQWLSTSLEPSEHLSFKTQSAALFARRFTAMRCMKFLKWNLCSPHFEINQ